MIGSVLHVEVKVDDTGWGTFLRVRVGIPLNKEGEVLQLKINAMDHL